MYQIVAILNLCDRCRAVSLQVHCFLLRIFCQCGKLAPLNHFNVGNLLVEQFCPTIKDNQRLNSSLDK